MSSRNILKQTVGTRPETDPSLGDEWNDTSSGRLYKYLAVDGTSPRWVEIFGKISSAGIALPTWTNITRPESSVNGQMGFNSTKQQAEIYLDQWGAIGTEQITYVEYLVVGGGGGGGVPGAGGAPGAGGGAGGLLTSLNLLVNSGIQYTITVGSGGAAGVGGNRGTNGNLSAFDTITAFGGGGGGGGVSASAGIGAAGGSGGGGFYGVAGGEGNTPATTPSQGNAGGAGPAGGTNGGWAGGGGGAGAEGQQGAGGSGGAGGAGILTSIISTTTAIAFGIGQYVTATNAVYFAGGGSSGGHTGVGNIGSLGGGGGGGGPSAAAGGGIAFTGGGGGGAGTGNTNAGAGGSGVVIIAYQNATQRGTGGTVTSYSRAVSGTYWVHTFTSSGSITF